ncbi:MAG: sugar phosphate isomerase/epimerase [Ruminococcaceae bacterium]|nr:sugar phosphate isomerase/epimerase [Oscillospiraceae bacterium]
MKIGVITDCFKLPLSDSIKKAKELGFQGIQVYATTGEFSPETLTETQKADFKAQLESAGLEISALCGDMGGHGFENQEDNAERVEKTKRIIDLAQEFGTTVITTHIGVIPEDKANPRYKVMLDALTECGLYAKEKGITLAIETGPETAPTLLQFIKDTKGGVGVNLDPANFVMVTGQDPVEAVELLGKHIVHTHVKDGVMLKRTDPKIIYDHFAEGGIEALNVADYFLETPLGEGDVDFPKYIEALKKVGFNGYLTVERETGENPAADIELAYNTVKSLL